MNDEDKVVLLVSVSAFLFLVSLAVLAHFNII